MQQRAFQSLRSLVQPRVQSVQLCKSKEGKRKASFICPKNAFPKKKNQNGKIVLVFYEIVL